MKFLKYIFLLSSLTLGLYPLSSWGKSPPQLNDETTTAILAQHGSQPQLQQYLGELFSKNPEIQSLLYQIEAAQNKVAQAGWLSDPQVGVNAMNIPSKNPSLKRTPMSGVEISLKQHVPFLSKLVTERKIERARYNQTQEMYLEKINQLVAKFKETYLEYSYTQEAIYIHNKNKSRLQAMKNYLQDKYTTDQVPLEDILKVKVSTGQIDSSLLSLQQISKTLQARLNTLLLNKVNHPIKPLRVNRLSAAPKNLQQLINQSKTTRPWLNKLDYEIKEKQKEQSLSRQALLPDFDFSGSYRVRENIPTDPVSGENFFSAGVAINLPFLWTLPKHSKKMAEAKSRLYAKQKEKEATVSEVTYQVTQYYQELKQLQSQVSLMNGQIIPSSQSSFNSSKNAYEAGSVGFLDVITAQNSLFTHELNLARYKYDYEKKKAFLEMAVGQYF